MTKKALDPLKPRILTKKKDQDKFITILNDEAGGYISRACKIFRCGVRTVQRRMAEDPHFKTQIDAIRESYRLKRLDALETVSIEAALDPKNYRERKFQLEALYPGKYRSNFAGYGNTPIQINFGFALPSYALNKTTNTKPKKDVTPDTIENTEIIDIPDDGLDDMDYSI